MRDTLLTIHILAACIWLGANVVGFIVNPQINPAARVIASDHWHHTVVGFKQRYIYTPSQLIVLISGVVLVIGVDGSPYEMSDTFVLIGFLAIFVAVLSGIYFAHQGRKVAAAYDADDVRTAASIEQKIARWSLVDTAVIVMTMGVMVSKLGAF
jgi:uncharacterized membrane protein|tara:strand:- start:720 stop:1181 length:462 start_codon:yes stop_codon:yes gene_type:complete